MATHQLQREEWKSYFDRVSRSLGARLAEIETAGLKIGDQINHEWTPLIGLTYDPKDDIIEVSAEDLDHIIFHPKSVHVEEAGVMLQSVDVLDAEGNHQIVRLREPLGLPPP